MFQGPEGSSGRVPGIKVYLNVGFRKNLVLDVDGIGMDGKNRRTKFCHPILRLCWEFKIGTCLFNLCVRG